MNTHSYLGYEPEDIAKNLGPIIPALAQAINTAAVRLADQTHGVNATAFDHDNAKEAILFALSDFFSLSQHEHCEDHIYPPLRPAQLTPRHLVAFMRDVSK